MRITDITKNSISLAWQKPEYDGGSPITGYMIEKREGVSSKWSKANLTNITDTRFIVTGLTQDETYEFRVMAKNAVGSVSNPSITVGPATCVDTYGRSFHVGLYLCIFFCNYALSCILRYLFHTLHILHPDLSYHLWSRCPRD